MNGKMKEVRFIDGLSESAWKSLIVKSLRIGWVAGLEEAAKRIPKNSVQACLYCGVFEDIFPAEIRHFGTAVQKKVIRGEATKRSRNKWARRIMLPYKV